VSEYNSDLIKENRDVMSRLAEKEDLFFHSLNFSSPKVQLVILLHSLHQQVILLFSWALWCVHILKMNGHDNSRPTLLPLGKQLLRK
jgi:hypothetical protein